MDNWIAIHHGTRFINLDRVHTIHHTKADKKIVFVTDPAQKDVGQECFEGEVAAVIEELAKRGINFSGQPTP